MQHLALGANSQVSSAPPHHRHLEYFVFVIRRTPLHMTESKLRHNAHSEAAEERIAEKSIFDIVATSDFYNDAGTGTHYCITLLGLAKEKQATQKKRK